MTAPPKEEDAGESLVRDVEQKFLQAIRKQKWVEDYEFSGRECEAVVAQLVLPLRKRVLGEYSSAWDDWEPTIEAGDRKRLLALRKAIKQLEERIEDIGRNPGTKYALEHEMFTHSQSEPEAQALSRLPSLLAHLDRHGAVLIAYFEANKRPRGAPPKTSQFRTIRAVAAILRRRIKKPTELARCVAEIVRLVRIEATPKRIQNILPIKSKSR